MQYQLAKHYNMQQAEKLKRTLYVGISLALLLVLFLGLVSYYTSYKETEAEKWSNHTLIVKAKIQEINTEIKDNTAAARATRRYTNVINFNKSEDREKLIKSIDNLKSLVVDNPSQMEKAIGLEEEVDNLFQLWGKINPEETRLNASKEELFFKEEVAIIQKIEVRLSLMDNTETALLEERRARYTQLLTFSSASNIGGTVLIFIIVLILANIIAKELTKRRLAEELLNEKLEELKILNTKTTISNDVLSNLRSMMDLCERAKNVSEFMSITLDYILNSTALSAGVIYLADENDQNNLIPGYFRGINPTQINNTHINSLLGVKADKSDVQILESIPSSFWNLSSATGSAQPGIIVYIHLKVNNKFIGLIELAGFQELDERQKAFLNYLPNSVSLRLSAIQLSDSRKVLVSELQEKQHILLNQQEELRQNNEELTQQTFVLQASEEELRAQEEELKQINTELEEKHSALESAKEVMSLKASELEQSGKFKSEFLANMSHELRTPLNSILILANLLGDNKNKNLTEKQVEYADIIAKSGSDLLNLINDILDLSKIEAGKIDLLIETFPINNVAENMKELFQVMMDNKHIDFNIKLDAGLPYKIDTDIQRLEQVLKNLLSNAFKFTNEGGSITLEIYADENQNIVFKVIDDGIGIDPSKLDLIFEAFRQEDGSTNRKYGGTGLGLSISKELAKMLKGYITVESNLGEGSEFSIVIPPNFADIPVVNTIPERIKVVPSIVTNTELDGQDKTLLIIEDDPNFARILKDFATEKNYKAIWAENGKEGIEAARKVRPDAIILDLQMPVMDGWEVLKLLKSDPALMHIPVHVISAMDDAKLPMNDLVAYVKKPVTITELEQTFQEISTYVNKEIHRLLVWSAAPKKDDTFQTLAEGLSNRVHCDFASAFYEVNTFIETHHYGCILVDVTSLEQDYLIDLKLLRSKTAIDDTAIILLIEKEISTSDELKMKRLSEAIILKSVDVQNRLKDELEQFIFNVKKKESTPVAFETPYTDNDILAGKKVLVVDDDMRNIFALVSLLEGQQMEVNTANNGIEAIQSLEQNPNTDIVLMDIMMPEMDGYEAMRIIRTNDSFKELPIIALTAKAMAEDKQLCIDAGASDYMSKPIDTQKLQSLLKIWLT